MKVRLLALSILLTVGLHAGTDIATQILNYQGQLTDNSGNAITTPQNMSFIIYAAQTGGSGIWSEAISNVPVTNGLFQVQLAVSINNTGSPVANEITPAQLEGNLWLEVTVNGTTMAPRTQLLASVFAYNSEFLQGLAPNNQPNNIPVLDGSGHLLSYTANISIPFPLSETGTGSGYAMNAQNTNLAAGQSGLTSMGYNGLSATAASASGVGILGQSASGDTAASLAIEGQAIQGVGVEGLSASGIGVKAQSSAASSPALSSSDSAGLGFLSSGLNGGAISASTEGLQIGGGSFDGQTLSTPQTGINIASDGNGIVISNVGTGYGLNASNSSALAAVNGSNASANGVGLSGENNQASSGASGFGIGSYGSSNSSSGFGVKGEALSTSGSNYGVYGDSASSNGIGVYGTAPQSGVEGVASGSGSIGTQGESNGGGTSFGVYGTAQSSSGAGVFGSSPNYGVYGFSSGSQASSYGVYGSAGAYGVVGNASNGSGAAWGVIGQSSSAAGIGVEGQAFGGGSGTRAGVEGLANGTGGTGFGVYGQGDSTGVYGVANGVDGGDEYGLYGDVEGSGSNRFGVYGTVDTEQSGDQVYGVFGELQDPDNTGAGVVGNNDGADGYGVLATNTEATDSSDLGAALAVSGRLKFLTDNAQTVQLPNTGNPTLFVVNVQNLGANDIVLLQARFNIDLSPTNAAQSNAIWVQSVSDGFFTVELANPVAGITIGGQNSISLSYVIIAK